MVWNGLVTHGVDGLDSRSSADSYDDGREQVLLSAVSVNRGCWGPEPNDCEGMALTGLCVVRRSF